MTAEIQNGRDRRPQPPTVLVDEMVDRYVDWREDAAAVGDAYRRWREADAAAEAWSYSAYLAALDQEQAAAITYELAVWDVERWLQRVEERRGRNPQALGAVEDRAKGGRVDVRSSTSPH